MRCLHRRRGWMWVRTSRRSCPVRVGPRPSRAIAGASGFHLGRRLEQPRGSAPCWPPPAAVPRPSGSPHPRCARRLLRLAELLLPQAARLAQRRQRRAVLALRPRDIRLHQIRARVVRLRGGRLSGKLAARAPRRRLAGRRSPCPRRVEVRRRTLQRGLGDAERLLRLAVGGIQAAHGEVHAG